MLKRHFKIMKQMRRMYKILVLVGIFFLLAFSVFSLQTPEKALLSFDVEPVDKADSVIKIIEILEQENVSATFFITGQYAELYPETVNRIAQNPDFEVACHSYSHPNMRKLNRTDKQEEINRSIQILQNISGRTVKGFRAPFHMVDKELFSILPDYFEYDASLIRNYPYFGIAHNADIHEIRVSSSFLPLEDVIFFYYLKAPGLFFFIAKHKMDSITSYVFHPHHIVQQEQGLNDFIKHLKKKNITFIKHSDLIPFDNG